MKVTIEHYIATNNPNQAQAVLAKYGLKARDMSDLIRKMHKLMKVKGAEAVKDFASINTPYKQLLLSTIKPVEVAAPIVETKSNACGCSSSANGEESSNACGCSGADGEETSGCDGGKCGCKNKVSTSNVEGEAKKSIAELKADAPKIETKEPTQAPKEKLVTKTENKHDMMPLVIVGVIGLIAVVAIIKS